MALDDETLRKLEQSVALDDLEFQEMLTESIRQDETKQYVTQQVTKTQEPTDEDVGVFSKALDYIGRGYKGYYEIGEAFIYGGAKGIGSASMFVADLLGADNAKAKMEAVQKGLDKQINKDNILADVASTVGQVGIGIAGTGGMGVASIGGRIVQGGAIDAIFFDEDSKNISDILSDFGVNNFVVDWAKNENADRTDLEKRMVNGLNGAFIGGALETVFSTFKYGHQLLTAKGVDIKSIPDEQLGNELVNAVKEESKNFDSSVNKIDDIPIMQNGNTLKQNDEELDKVVLAKQEQDEMLKETIPLNTVAENNFILDELNITDSIKQSAKNILDNLDIKLDPRITPSQFNINDEKTLETLAQVAEGTSENLVPQSYKQQMKNVDKELKKMVSNPTYDLLADFEKTALKTRGLNEDIVRQKVLLGAVYEQLAVSKEALLLNGGNASETLKLAYSAMMAKQLTNLYVEGSSNVARALNAHRINPAMSKVLDEVAKQDLIDPRKSFLMIDEALKKGDNEEVIKLLEDILDPYKDIKDIIGNTSDKAITKIGNVLSEYGVAQMLSSPSTMTVSMLGNSYVKHEKYLQTLAQYAWGKVLNTEGRKTLQQLQRATRNNFLTTSKDVSDVASLAKDYVKSGLKDEIIDEGILIRFLQDQEYHRQYFSSRYILGMQKGSENTFRNNAINVMGRVARTPYRAIGLIDDYYKRQSFRVALTDIGDNIYNLRKDTTQDYVEFIDKFEKVNTDLMWFVNQGRVSKKDEEFMKFIKDNRTYLPKGKDVLEYINQAKTFANDMTFQSDISHIPIVGKTVDALNSSGWLRTAIPFKLTPINLLRKAYDTGTSTVINKKLWQEVAKGGINRDVALAKMTVSTTLVGGLYTAIAQGVFTGTARDQNERNTMQSAGIPELSMKIGNSWVEYKQIEPIATIAGVLTDAYRIGTEMAKYSEIDNEDIDEFYAEHFKNAVTHVSQNILQKTYFKSLADVIDTAMGNNNLSTYGGNVISSMLPASSMVSFNNRVWGDEYKKEAKTITERIMSKYAFLLDREALDAYGRPIKNTDYYPVFLMKEVKIDEKANKGAMEVARLGIGLSPMNDSITVKGFDIKLEPEEYWNMRRSMDTEFKLSDRLNNVVSSKEYLKATDEVRKIMLDKIIVAGREYARNKAVVNVPKLRETLTRKVQEKVKEIQTDTQESNFNNLIIDRLED